MSLGLAREVTGSRHVLPICTRAWTHSARGTLCQLVGPWKLLEVSFVIFSFVALGHAKENCNPCSYKLSSYSLLYCKLSSCKLYSLVHCIFVNCIHLVHFILANCIHLVYYVLVNYIQTSLFFF